MQTITVNSLFYCLNWKPRYRNGIFRQCGKSNEMVKPSLVMPWPFQDHEESHKMWRLKVNFSALRVVTFLSTYHNQPALNYLFRKTEKKLTLSVYFQYYLMLTQPESMCQIFNFLPNGWSKLTNVWDGSHMFCSTLIILLFVL